MKTKTVLLLFSLAISISAIGQDACNSYFPFKEGTKFEITNYNKKGKKEGAVKYHVSKINGNTATIEAKILDKKGEEVTTTSYEVTCEGNSISIDFKSMISPDMLKQYKDMELDITGTNIELPNNLEVGQKLKDANLVMSINMAGFKMNITLDMLNKVVDAQESVTTPAGSFDCAVISYDSVMKMGIKTAFKIKEWLAVGVGIVKTETYNKNGKLMGYSELTSFSE